MALLRSLARRRPATTTQAASTGVGRHPLVVTSSAAPLGQPVGLPTTWLAPDRHAFLIRPDGALLRVTTWQPPDPCRGSIVMLGGRAEFIEKYAMEMAGELHQRGFALYAMDWRGQGLSSRSLPDRERGHIDSFATYQGDLDAFLEHVVLPAAPRPILALGHSMGGHALLEHLAAHGPETPFASAILSAPMTGLCREAALRAVLMLMPERPQIDSRYFYGMGPYAAGGRDFRTNILTRDERRYRFTEAWFDADPRLVLGGPTTGWLRQAARAMRALLLPGHLERIVVPVTIHSAGRDLLVDSTTHGAVASRISGGRLVSHPEARHEILMETDEIRAAFLADLDRTLAEVVSAT
jgi:lysophospholipase